MTEYLVRNAIAGLFATLLVGGPCAAHDTAPLLAEAPRRAVIELRPFVQRLTRDHPDVLGETSLKALSQGLSRYFQTSGALAKIANQRGKLSEQDYRSRMSMAGAEDARSVSDLVGELKRVPGLVAIEGGGSAIARDITVPFASTVALVWRSGPGSPSFVWRRIDAAMPGAANVEVPVSGPFFCALELTGVPRPGRRLPVVLRTPEGVAANLRLRLIVPRLYPLTVKIETGGEPTEATVGLYSESRRLLVPDTALDFSEAGQGYGRERFLFNRTSRYWPGKQEYLRAFYLRGSFTIDVPAGNYRLMATKGPEFEPVDRIVAVGPGQPNAERIDLRRWIDMSARGWHSGDSHLHFERRDPSANERLALWVKAEDLRMANVLRMGDGKLTYYEQYAFGKAGRFVQPNLALVPGQEDPRTNVLGHTLHLNLQHAIRFAPESYYVYSDVFDEAHRQNALSGYAHVNSMEFQVERDMTLNIPLGKVDFAEICEFGNVRTALYYEFLNLGYRLTATGGSDVPYAGSAGDSRVYVFTGRAFDPDEWFAEFRKGRTFVTAGPMLEFTVNGRQPGEVIDVSGTGTLRIRARVTAGPGILDPEALEIVANGEVIKAAKTSRQTAMLEFEVPVNESMWIAARAKGAHTTPVYVRVDGRRHWSRADVPRLLEKRLATLLAIGKLVEGEDALPEGAQIRWENRDAFAHDRERMRQAIAAARREYSALKAEFDAGSKSTKLSRNAN